MWDFRERLFAEGQRTGGGKKPGGRRKRKGERKYLDLKDGIWGTGKSGWDGGG